MKSVKQRCANKMRAAMDPCRFPQIFNAMSGYAITIGYINHDKYANLSEKLARITITQKALERVYVDIKMEYILSRTLRFTIT